MGATQIPYSDRTWETIGGCTKIGAGCKNCWAIRLINRFAHNPVHKGRYVGLVEDGDWTSEVKLFHDRLDEPLKRAMPTRYFVNPRSDTFHKKVPDESIDKMLSNMILCKDHTFQLFTKRYKRAADYFCGIADLQVESERDMIIWDAWRAVYGKIVNERYWPPPNIHLFFSVSTQQELDRALPLVLDAPVAFRGFSFEPLLEPLDFYGAPGTVMHDYWQGQLLDSNDGVGSYIHAIIIGCESGSKRRPCKLEWIRSIVQQCKAAGVACYVKQIDTQELRPQGVLKNKVSTDPAE